MSRARRAVATVAVLAALVATVALFKGETCSCTGGLPYATVAIWSGVLAATAFGAYVAAGLVFKQD
jgi:hypothetical protein